MDFLTDGRATYATKDKLFMQDNGELRALAELVVESMDEEVVKNIDLDQIEFALVEGDTGDYLGKAVKIPPLYRLFMKKKFLIIFNTTRIEADCPTKYDMIMLHELIHCNTEWDLIRTHDVEDFSWMLRKFGLDWATDQKISIVQEGELVELLPWVETKSSKEERDARRQAAATFATKEDLSGSTEPKKPTKKDPDVDESESHTTKLPAKKKSSVQERIAKAFQQPSDGFEI